MFWVQVLVGFSVLMAALCVTAAVCAVAAIKTPLALILLIPILPIDVACVILFIDGVRDLIREIRW